MGVRYLATHAVGLMATASSTFINALKGLTPLGRKATYSRDRTIADVGLRFAGKFR